MEKTIDGIPKNSPILLLGEGTSGTLLKELVEKGFSNLRSIDVLYKALDRNYEKNYSARENGDAANLKNVASNSQKLVLSKDLLGSAPESKVYPILTETIRVLAPQGEARHSFVGIETSILLDAAAVILSNNDIRVEVVTTNSKKHEGYIKIIKNTSASKNKSPFNFEEPPPPAAISLALLTTIVEGKTLARKPKNIEGISTQYRLSFNNHYEKQWELLFKKVLSQIVTVTLSERFIDKLRIYFNEKVRKPLENGNSSLAASNLAILDSLTAQVKVLRTYSFKERPFYLIDGNLDDKQFLIPSETGIQDINTVPSLDYYNSVSDINRRLKNYNWGDGKNDDSP